ncbi:MAG TPA: site-2 protease family protein [Bordetella sp.]
MNEIIQTIAVYALPLIFAITLHEAAHGYVARLFGDPTAAQAGRISLNPARHIDPVGTLLVPIVMLLGAKLLGGPSVLFGWARPVPVNFGRLRRPKRDMLWVALAGPAANLAMALAWALLLRACAAMGLQEHFWFEMALAGVNVNLVLMAMNLLPVPPLDGGRIVFSLLPNRAAWHYARIEPYGLMIVMLLLVTGSLGLFLGPLLALGRLVVGWIL